MDSDAIIRKLQEELAQAKEERDKAVAERDNIENERKRAQQLLQKTTLKSYLKLCHEVLYRTLTVQPGISSTSVTRVDGKYYPLRCCYWKEFEVHRQREFEFLKGALKDERVFSSKAEVLGMQRRACAAPVANEEDIKAFEQIAVEGPVSDIVGALGSKAASNPMVTNLNTTGISFANHSHGISSPVDEFSPSDVHNEEVKRHGDLSPTKRVAIERKDIKPDRLGIRETHANDRMIFCVIEYKAAHQQQADQVRRHLNEHLFTTAINRSRSTKLSTDNAQASDDRSLQMLAKSMTQAYDYMIKLGIQYGYIAIGKIFIFLYIRAEDPKTLYYFLANPQEEVGDGNSEFRESNTAVAQVASFSLLALRSKPLSRSWVAEAREMLCQWPVPYPAMENDTTDEELSRTLSHESDRSYRGEKAKASSKPMTTRSRSACKDTLIATRKDEADDADDDDADGAFDRKTRSGPSVNYQSKRKDAPSSNSGDSSFDEISNLQEQSRPYCTMGCLLGLKGGQQLDLRCPNVTSHRVTSGDIRHPVDVKSLTRLLQEQLASSLDVGCEPLEMKGLYGKVGSLFKLTLTQYGYTFVGKGTTQECVQTLRREAKVYARLEKLQGKLIPVALGSINLSTPYHLTARYAVRFAGTEIVHMLLMSWAGVTMTTAQMGQFATEMEGSLQRIRREGVLHEDVREANLLFNEELSRPIIIDFHSTTLFSPKPKKSTRPSEKRKWKDCHSQSRSDTQNPKRRFLGTA